MLFFSMKPYILLCIIFSKIFEIVGSNDIVQIYSTNHGYLHIDAKRIWFLANAFAPALGNTQTRLELL